MTLPTPAPYPRSRSLPRARRMPLVILGISVLVLAAIGFYLAGLLPRVRIP